MLFPAVQGAGINVIPYLQMDLAHLRMDSTKRKVPVSMLFPAVQGAGINVIPYLIMDLSNWQWTLPNFQYKMGTQLGAAGNSSLSGH